MMIVTEALRRIMRRSDDLLVPDTCRRKFISLDARQEAAVVDSIIQNYYMARGYDDPRVTPDLAGDFDDAVYGTVNRNRRTVIPWLHSLCPLDGLRILEVGTGAGGSIVPLLEQGAYVLGTDVDANSLKVAEDRCKAYGLEWRTEIRVVNAADLRNVFSPNTFDAVIFFASLEHMTIEERLAALAAAWELVKPQSWMAVIETPNRLWWYDDHTSHLPFYNWLPDDLALRYRIHSPRKDLRDVKLCGSHKLLTFARMGRGVSYHEFQIALPGIDLRQITSCMPMWQRRNNPLRMVYWHASGNAGYTRLLRQHAPDIHPAFFEPYLNFVLTKSSTPGTFCSVPPTLAGAESR